MKALLVEDERPLGLAISRMLTDAGFRVSWAGDGQDGFETAMKEEFDVLVLDVLLPRKNGWDICRDLRLAKRNYPILMLTALDEVNDKVKGLQIGADDYVAKPFDSSELVARTLALVRRHKANKNLVATVADLEVDRVTSKVKRAGVEIKLTRREYDLLEALIANVGRVLTRQVIQERVWTYDDRYSNTVDVFIGSLRKKIDAGHARKLIHTVHGLGYMLKADPE